MEMKSVGVMVRTELNCDLDFSINGYHFLCCSHIVRLYHELRSVEIISKYRFRAHICQPYFSAETSVPADLHSVLQIYCKTAPQCVHILCYFSLIE